MLKVVHIPLDERPCNFDFPKEMFEGKEFEVIRPSFDDMGLKKRPGNIKNIQDFFKKECKDSYAAVVSIDTLIYGGIVPSRLHYNTFEEILERLDILKEVKKENPSLKLYCYSLVMRCPHYSDDDEEPFYYNDYGLDIHERKAIEHKMMLNIASEEEKKQYKEYNIPSLYIEDYEKRREINTNITIEVVKMVKEGLIEFLIIPQDDSAPYGYTALDQNKIRMAVYERALEFKVLTYPGADEVSNTLFARMLNEYYHKRPLVYVKYPTDSAKLVIPCAEDRPLEMSIKSQLIASGCLFTDNLKEADLVLACNAPAKYMCSIGFEEYRDYASYEINRNMVDFVEFIKYCIEINKPVTICDIGYANGADVALVKLLDNYKLFFKLAGYASWNIPCNTLGTALPMGIRYIHPHNKEKFENFLMHRFVEDIGYCGRARTILRKTFCNETTGFTIYDTKGKRNETFIAKTKEVMIEQLSIYAPSLVNCFEFEDMYFPWGRTYEVGLKIKYLGNYDDKL